MSGSKFGRCLPARTLFLGSPRSAPRVGYVEFVSVTVSVVPSSRLGIVDRLGRLPFGAPLLGSLALYKTGGLVYSLSVTAFVSIAHRLERLPLAVPFLGSPVLGGTCGRCPRWRFIILIFFISRSIVAVRHCPPAVRIPLGVPTFEGGRAMSWTMAALVPSPDLVGSGCVLCL